jgi:hypothetical protein
VVRALLTWIVTLAAAAASNVPRVPPAVIPPPTFQPFSATFVSPTTAFVLGGRDCSEELLCTIALLRTEDRGRTWASVSAPRVTSGLDDGTITGVRFANSRDGYLFGKGLLSTHDGGRRWAQVPLPACESIDSLDIGTGVVRLVANCKRGVALFTGPFTRDAFTQIDIPQQYGAAPIDGVQIVVIGTRAWLAAIGFHDGLVGASELAHGAWRPWPSVPCRTATGTGYPELALEQDTSAIEADCLQFAGPPTVTRVESTDGGATFHAVGNVFDDERKAEVRALDAVSGGDVEPADIAFTTPTQAFSIVDIGRTNSTALFLTTDAGNTWHKVAFSV